jgi:hypothetical protein
MMNGWKPQPLCFHWRLDWLTPDFRNFALSVFQISFTSRVSSTASYLDKEGCYEIIALFYHSSGSGYIVMVLDKGLVSPHNSWGIVG